MQFFKVDLKKHTDSSLKKSDGFLSTLIFTFSNLSRHPSAKRTNLSFAYSESTRIFLENLQEWRPE